MSILTAIFIFITTWLLISINDLQLSAGILNQLPGQLASSAYIRIKGV